jgi:MoaA/NifB/PqqE/SkfB family radical SAM enzyme
LNKLHRTKQGFTQLINKRPLNSSTEIRITHLCTQRCRQCQIYDRQCEPASMTLNMFKTIAQKLRDYGAHIGFISGGEPTLVPHLEDILIQAKETFPVATTLVTGLYNKTRVIERVGRAALELGANIQTSLDGLGKVGDNIRGVSHFSDTVLNHMELLSKLRRNSKSLLYANIVLSNLNLDQVPQLIARAKDLDWEVTIGLYHNLTQTSRGDGELSVRQGPRLDRLLEFLDGNLNILNLNSFIRGIGPFVAKGNTHPCPFVQSRFLSTRTTIYEDGGVYLCFGGEIGNIFTQSLSEIFSSDTYKNRLREYAQCPGCWTTCYTQRYLLVHPRSLTELVDNVRKIRRVRRPDSTKNEKLAV